MKAGGIASGGAVARADLLSGIAGLRARILSAGQLGWTKKVANYTDILIMAVAKALRYGEQKVVLQSPSVLPLVRWYGSFDFRGGWTQWPHLYEIGITKGIRPY